MVYCLPNSRVPVFLSLQSVFKYGTAVLNTLTDCFKYLPDGLLNDFLMTNLYIYNAPFAELKFDNETLYMRADK